MLRALRRLQTRETLLFVALAALAVALALVLARWRRVKRWYERRCREGFFPGLVPLIGLGLTAAGVGAKVTGVDKKIQDQIWKPGGVGEKIPGIGGGGGAGGGPTYVGRKWDGADWSCPDGTIETGMEDAKACITSQFHPPVWRDTGNGKWDHGCPWGTTGTGESAWEKKCEVGHMGRVFLDNKWQCPSGTTDTGNNWDKGPREGAKQCKRGRAYGTRMWDGKAWVCPPGTKDTGRSWNSPTNGGDQCKFLGG